MEGTMATATRTPRTRTAAQPEVQNVTTRRGGKVHAPNTVLDWPFPRCRTGAQTRQPTHGRYVITKNNIDCEKCVEIIRADRGARKARETLPGRATAAERTPTGDPYAGKIQPRRRNGKAQDKANAQAEVIIAEETAKVIAKRDEPVRLPKCSDEDFALAQQVRGLREQGRAWWAIAHELELPGSGPSVKQGKTGAAHARRAWEKAWGPTYKDTSVPRDTKAAKAERAITQPGKPYFTHDEEDGYVVAAVTGHEIEWVTRLGAGDGVVCSVQKAEVSKDAKVEVVQGPKGRVLKFYEIIRDEKGIPLVGPLRSVYVDRIERVGR